jgi:hypothetical protein
MVCVFLAKGDGRSVRVCRTVRKADRWSVRSDWTIRSGWCVSGGSVGNYGLSVIDSRMVLRR